MHPVAEEFERKLLPRFEGLAERLSAQFPDVVVRVFSGSVGSLTEYQGYHIGVECLLTNASGTQPDNVALSVDLRHLSTTPKVDAGVCWGHPSGHSEAEFRPEPLEVSGEVTDDLYAELPRLFESLVKAVKKGTPSDWDEGHA